MNEYLKLFKFEPRMIVDSARCLKDGMFVDSGP